MLTRLALRSIGNGSQRHASTMVPKISKKTFYESWCNDPGCYPLMVVIPVSCVLPVLFGIYLMRTSPDARVSKHSRKAFLRGDYKNLKPAVNE